MFLYIFTCGVVPLLVILPLSSCVLVLLCSSLKGSVACVFTRQRYIGQSYISKKLYQIIKYFYIILFVSLNYMWYINMTYRGLQLKVSIAHTDLCKTLILPLTIISHEMNYIKLKRANCSGIMTICLDGLAVKVDNKSFSGKRILWLNRNRNAGYE